MKHDPLSKTNTRFARSHTVCLFLTNRRFFEFCLAQQLLCSTQRSHSETFRTCPETSWRRKLREIQPTASAVYFGRKRCETLNFGLSEVNIGTVDRDSHIKGISTLPCNIYGEVRFVWSSMLSWATEIFGSSDHIAYTRTGPAGVGYVVSKCPDRCTSISYSSILPVEN